MKISNKTWGLLGLLLTLLGSVTVGAGLAKVAQADDIPCDAEPACEEAEVPSPAL